MTASRSTIFWKAFLSMVLGLLLWIPVFFALTVPVVNRIALEMEEAAARNVLDNIVQSVRQAHGEIAAWRKSALDAHKREMRAVVLTAEFWAEQLNSQVNDGQLTQAQARKAFFDGVRRLRFGNGSYLWVADTSSFVHVHPDPRFDRQDASNLRDAKGNLVFPPMVEDAVRDQAGYTTNWWRRMDTWREDEQLSYFHYYPNWRLVIGTGVYLDEIRAEAERRKAQTVEQLRANLHRLKLPHDGYVVVIDGGREIVIHPQVDLEGKSMLAPEFRARTGGVDLGQAWVDAAATPDGRLSYRFSPGPGAPGAADEKIAWIRYVPEFDWYLGATVYRRDLESSGQHLASRMGIAFLIGFLITALVSFFLIRRLTQPILELAGVATRQGAGDLDALAEVRGNDEFAVLAEAFNAMVRRLRSQIGTLEERVAERTRELAEWAGLLEQRVAERTAELAASEMRFRGVVENTVAGIFVLQNGRFVYANTAFAAIHGFDTPEELMAVVASDDILQPEVREEIGDETRRLLSGEQGTVQRLVPIRRRDGTPATIELSGCAIDLGGSPAVLGVVLDVTRRIEAEAAREQALAQAEELSRLKSDFIANMSHEFRTPLNIIMGMAHVARRAKTLEKAQEASGEVLGQSRRLLELVTQLLDFSSIESGRVEIERAPVDLPALAREVAAAFTPPAAAKGLALEVCALPELPEFTGDRERIRRVLDILLDNAIKFTNQGGIRIDLVRDPSTVAIEITDTGIGMEASEVSKLFRPFVQADGTSTRRFGGMGLSLALARRYAQLMGGTLDARSSPDEGSTFSLRLPCQAMATESETMPA